MEPQKWSNYKKAREIAGCQGLTPVIPAIQEAEIRRMVVWTNSS
jgi:hypothetical protein